MHQIRANAGPGIVMAGVQNQLLPSDLIMSYKTNNYPFFKQISSSFVFIYLLLYPTRLRNRFFFFFCLEMP